MLAGDEAVVAKLLGEHHHRGSTFKTFLGIFDELMKE